MTAAALLNALRRRGIALEFTADGLRYRAPAGALTAADREALRQRRDELVALLRAAGTADDALVGPILAAGADAAEPLAWLLYSQRVEEELWLVRDAAALEVIRHELVGRPVVVADELPVLRALQTDALRAVLAAKAAFPGSRLLPTVARAQEGFS